ncbi:hypothetical protein UFOVP1357_10 [uncultured Caudovirales phage]|uniref:Uncharacterized protein n=1 Tax=uncultured Caudovirales phage TaxID=2100421 RepID=A0A6J5KZV3_9CAUD|nr:hypothetical protein UFOVP18_4 [uncultured Caudovirales phage]CAB4126597.1 hypothetical protein UFOVP82_6 [uncultured Caudovirales phage]CAB4132707.1 hypothetical protein UFOVP258_55 [uncultured Caudovirales phage]CAB4146611.1 hypothetical protein UFOVP502_47 [uncultured Caudovirales phage]CAB4199717.1 hypothetical protein UFOVP1357_10 [uncultured Caudovirales phage]
MKVNILDAHDRLKEFVDRSQMDINECCQDLINQRPFGSHAFYIFAHKRTLGLDEKFKLFSSGKYYQLSDVPEATIIWQPRLTKPKAQTNSMLFKAYPGTDKIKVIWMIPDRDMWPQYQKDNLTESHIVSDSIWAFENDRGRLEVSEDDDLSDEAIDQIYRSIGKGSKPKSLIVP